MYQKRASRTAHSDLRRGVRICQSSLWITSRVKRKEIAMAIILMKRNTQCQVYTLSYPGSSLMSPRGVNASFDGKLCTSVEAYLWGVQSAFCGLSEFLSTSLWYGWQMSFSSYRWQESWNAQRLSTCWTFIF